MLFLVMERAQLLANSGESSRHIGNRNSEDFSDLRVTEIIEIQNEQSSVKWIEKLDQPLQLFGPGVCLLGRTRCGNRFPVHFRRRPSIRLSSKGDRTVQSHPVEPSRAAPVWLIGGERLDDLIPNVLQDVAPFIGIPRICPRDPSKNRIVVEQELLDASDLDS